jgi:glucose-6-phosphate-specific signal transduction histidine kinase
MPAGAEITRVSISGMLERVRLLKGDFNITTAATGTILHASLPNRAEIVDDSWQAVAFEI